MRERERERERERGGGGGRGREGKRGERKRSIKTFNSNFFSTASTSKWFSYLGLVLLEESSCMNLLSLSHGHSIIGYRYK